MKNEVAARAVAMAELARIGLPAARRPLAARGRRRGGRHGRRRHALAARGTARHPARPGDQRGRRRAAAAGRRPGVQTVEHRREGHLPGAGGRGRRGRARVDAGRRRQRGPAAGRAAAPGRPRHAAPTVRRRWWTRTLEVLLGGPSATSRRPVPGGALHPVLARHRCPRWPARRWRRRCSTGSTKRNVMPARASVELDCRILPGHHRGRRRARRSGPGSATTSPTSWSWPEALVAGSASTPPSELMDAIVARAGRARATRPRCCRCCAPASRTRSTCARRATPTAYGFSPFRSTSAEVLGGRLPQRRRARARRRPAALGGVPRRPGERPSRTRLTAVTAGRLGGVGAGRTSRCGRRTPGSRGAASWSAPAAARRWRRPGSRSSRSVPRR